MKWTKRQRHINPKIYVYHERTSNRAVHGPAGCCCWHNTNTRAARPKRNQRWDEEENGKEWKSSVCARARSYMDRNIKIANVVIPVLVFRYAHIHICTRRMGVFDNNRLWALLAFWHTAYATTTERKRKRSEEKEFVASGCVYVNQVRLNKCAEMLYRESNAKYLHWKKKKRILWISH